MTRARAAVAWDLCYQSRSGPPQVPWLEPDIVDHLRALAKEGVRDVVLSPLGFVSDHMEVVWDLDHEAQDEAQKLGIGLHRVATPGTDPRFVAMVEELVRERTEDGPRQALGTLGPWPDVCRGPQCCDYVALRPGKGTGP